MSRTFSIKRGFATEIIAQYKTGLERELQQTNDSLVRELLQLFSQLDASRLEAVLEACFFGSFEREEGRTHHFSIAVAPPLSAISESIIPLVSSEVFAQTYSFKNPLDVDKLPKIAPALAKTRQRIGVWFEGSNPKIWGFAGMSTLLTASLQIRTVQPGYLAIFVPLSFRGGLFVLSPQRAELIRGKLRLSELLFGKEDFKNMMSSDHLTVLRYSGRIQR